MQRYQHTSYSEYLYAQIRKNLKKLSVIAVSDEELEFIAKFIKAEMPYAEFGICHGVRNGYEVSKLRTLLAINIIGTEISPTAHDYDNVVQWDFHNLREEWRGKADFIYSNSWDHSYNPDLMLKTWMATLKPEGRLFLQWTPYHAASVDDADCLAADLVEFQKLLLTHGRLEDETIIQQWRVAGQGRLYNLLRRFLRRTPVKTVHLLVVAH